LEQSLRADVESYIGGRLGGVREEIARLQSQLNEALTRVAERLADASQPDASVAVTISEHLRDARNRGIEAASTESQQARSSSDVAVIKAAIEELDNQRTQADILNSLVNRAATFAPRVAFFVIKQDRATGWRARGLEGTVGDDSVREISLPLAADTLLGEVARTRSPWSGAPGTHGDDREIFGKFDEEPPQRIVAVPLVARDKAVAVLYADSARQDSDAVNLEALETLVRVAGMAVELLATKRPAPAASSAAAAAPAPTPQPTPPAPTTASQPTPQPESQPEPATPTPVTPFQDYSQQSSASDAYASSTAASTSDEASVESTAPPLFAATPERAADSSAQSSEAYETAATYEPAPSYETAPAASFEPAPAYEQSAPVNSFEMTPAPSTPTRRSRADDAPLPVEVSGEQELVHKKARSFARLLVSEIKLYNKSKVEEGLTRGDLYNRLREDIDRARKTYDADRRVTPEVSGRYDYFHHELVSQLAGGDSSKLGADYPGASPSSS